MIACDSLPVAMFILFHLSSRLLMLQCQKHLSILQGTFLYICQQSTQVNERTGVEIAKEVNEVAWDICRYNFVQSIFSWEEMLI